MLEITSPSQLYQTKQKKYDVIAYIKNELTDGKEIDITNANCLKITNNTIISEIYRSSSSTNINAYLESLSNEWNFIIGGIHIDILEHGYAKRNEYVDTSILWI